MFIRKVEDSKAVIKTCESKKDRKCNCQTKNKRINNDLQNSKQKPRDRATLTKLKSGGGTRMLLVASVVLYTG